MADFPKEFCSRRQNRALGETAERELRKLLERDEGSLKELQRYENHISLEVLNSTSRCASALASLENAKRRHELAVELHATLARSIDILKLSNSVLSKAQDSSASDPNIMQHLADISLALRAREEDIERRSEEATEALKSVSRAHETVIIAEEDYEGALTILWHQKEEHLISKRRIKELQETVRGKKIPLQASFRVPPHVWEGIFEYIVSADGEMKGERNEHIKGWEHGSRALMLSSVCYSWRIMIQSSPPLWRYIYIPLNFTFEHSWKRVNLYLGKCRAVPPVVAVYSPTSKTFQIKWLQNLVNWNHAVGLARLKCTVDAGAPYENLRAILKQLPSPVILRLWDGSTSDGITTPVLNIPPSLLGAMKRMETVDMCTQIETDSPSGPPVKIEAYVHTGTVSNRCKLPPWLRELHIMSLRVDGYWELEDRYMPYSFTSVQELEIPLEVLSKYLMEGYGFPSLRKIALISTKRCSSEDWERVTGIPFEDLRIIGLKSVERSHVTSFVAFVQAMQRASSLELKGQSVDTLQAMFDDSALASSLNVELLTISDYKGTASSILSYVRRHAEREGLQIQESDCDTTRPNKHALRRVVFVGCPNVEPETRLEIAALLTSLWEN